MFDLSYYTSFEVDHVSLTRRELEDTNLRIKQGLTHGKFRGMVDASDDAQLVVELFRKIKFSIDKLTVQFTCGFTLRIDSLVCLFQVVSVVKAEAIAWVRFCFLSRYCTDPVGFLAHSRRWWV